MALMKLDWDEAKNVANIEKHGIDFNDARELFEHPLLRWLDDRQDYGEDRWIGMGNIQGRLMVVVYTERAPDIIRLISVRKANKRESKRYEQAIERLKD